MTFHMINNSNSSFLFFWFIVSFGMLFLMSHPLMGQYDIPPRPSTDASLVFNYSETDILTPSQQQALNRKLIDFEAKTSTQIALIIIDSLYSEDSNYLGARWLADWKIGQKDEDNGMVILMSTGDRRISIQNGYGLEEYMTDAKSRQIIDNFIIPYFKQAQYYDGFDNGLDAIFRVLEGKFIEDGSGYNNSEESEGLWLFLLLLLGMFALIWILSRNNGGGGNGGRRGSLGDVIFTDFGRSTWAGPRGGFGGGFGGGGSFGGGGFGGFGGGMGGGGGASGGW